MALQCSGSFCCTAKWISYMCTGIPSVFRFPSPLGHHRPLSRIPCANSSAWRIPGMGEPGGLPSMGLHRVGHDWSNLAATVVGKLNFIPSINRVYVSAPIFQFIPLPFLPLVSIHLFSTSVSLFLLCLWVHLYHFLDSTYKQYYVTFWA